MNTTYVLQPVNNGWILTVPANPLDSGASFGDFVFCTLDEVYEFLRLFHPIDSPCKPAGMIL